jgi:uncharacterized protein (TIGR03382 family)
MSIGLGLVALPAFAQVLEPNGVSVPATVNNGEITLQSYLDSQMEGINAVADAQAEPGVFLPLCDFQAALVLSQSNAQGGLAWYNVPATPTETPATVYPIGSPAAVVGQVITSADVRSNPAYANGLIGFVLMKNGQRVYYSEYMRNAYCSQCSMPGYWKMALAYQSKVMPNTYYLAFEDWEGANDMTWFGNDGDFNDKVFRISGVTCEGGGDSCDTAQPGVCSSGVTECQPGGNIVCKQTIQPASEKCDNLDNDCNGQIDDGDGLCPGDQVCVHGTCIPPCGAAEFDCPPPFVCESSQCVDPACVGKTCDTGQVCRGGACVGGCEGVVCPAGQQCQLGACVDPCAGVSCPGAVCERGACLTDCHCRTCGAGQVCAADGHCVDAGCDGMTCPAGMVCKGGSCMDACEGAQCPGGAACHDGLCDPPVIVGPSGSGGAGASTGVGGQLGGGAGGSGVTGGLGGSLGAGTAGASGHDAGTGETGAGGSTGKVSPECGCDASGGSPSVLGLLLLLGLRRLGRRR